MPSQKTPTLGERVSNALRRESHHRTLSEWYKKTKGQQKGEWSDIFRGLQGEKFSRSVFTFLELLRANHPEIAIPCPLRRLKQIKTSGIISLEWLDTAEGLVFNTVYFYRDGRVHVHHYNREYGEDFLDFSSVEDFLFAIIDKSHKSLCIQSYTRYLRD